MVRLFHYPDEKLADLQAFGSAGLIVPCYPSYDRDTADLKVTVYLEPKHPIALQEKKKMRNQSLSILLDALSKPLEPTVTYLLHSSHFRAFEALQKRLYTFGKTSNDNSNDTNDNPLHPWPGKIKCLAVVPSQSGDLSPQIFDRIVEWAYTGDYLSSSTSPDGKIVITGKELDKKIGAVGITLVCPPLLEIAVRKLRDRMDSEADAVIIFADTDSEDS
ncbi:hypothetical protein ABW20_dc0102482 [Dactylellina cionopaga]|nr:hypothetical protein ABW20_dc0102482 [Dactylellina cionopaga]